MKSHPVRPISRRVAVSVPPAAGTLTPSNPGALALVLGCLALATVSAPAQTTNAATAASASWTMGVTNYLGQVLERNQRLKADLLTLRATNSLAKAERGIFEPAFVGSVDHTENRKQNTARDVVSLGNQLFDERNNSYSSALEFLVPTGARLRVGYSLRDIRNNLQFGTRTNGEWETFIGGNLVQPLLRNAGPSATRYGIRQADLNSEVAQQEFRKSAAQLMGAAEAAYFGLYLAQQQLRTFEESVRVAESVLADFKVRAQTGKASDLDVLQSEADLSVRRNGRNDAAQKLAEARARASAFLGTTERDARGVITAEAPGQPKLGNIQFEYHWPNLFDFNPDYLAQRKRVELEGVKLAFARNQRLPQLDLKASYGMNGLDRTPGASWDQVTTGDYPSWYVGVEFRAPLGGDRRGRHEVAAARDRQSATLLALKDLETQLGSVLTSTLNKIEHNYAAIADTETTVRLNQALLDTEMARLEVGRVEARKVLEVERDLLIARLNALAAVIQYHESTVDLEILTGRYLFDRGLETPGGALATGDPDTRGLGTTTREEFQRRPTGN